MPTDCRLRVSGKNDDGDAGDEIGNTMYPASGPLGGGSLRAASNPVYDHSCLTEGRRRRIYIVSLVYFVYIACNFSLASLPSSALPGFI